MHWLTAQTNLTSRSGLIHVSGACVGEPPPNPEEEDIDAGPQQGAGATGWVGGIFNHTEAVY